MTNQQNYSSVVVIAIIEIANLTCFCCLVAILATSIEIERTDFRMIDFVHFVMTTVDMNSLIDMNAAVVETRKHYFVCRTCYEHVLKGASVGPYLISGSPYGD